MLNLRKTKIICTLGPAVDSEDMVRALIRGGMNAARFNFSHGSHAEHLERLNRLKAVRDAMGRPIATILDTKGPEIRIRSFAEKSVTLTAGEDFTLTTDDVVGDNTRVSVTYAGLHEELTPGQEILIDDGLIAIRVKEIVGHEIRCTVENDFDYIAASFVRRAADVEAVRAVLRECGGSAIRIIAKIENQEGVDNLDEILAAADGIMVARGDLGVEISAARVPVLQKKMIRKGMQAGKPVITATQMLDSMMRNPRPTRAEVSDVANAVFDGTSCVMLSGETAGGKYPVEALSAMVGIITEAEQSIHYWNRFMRREIVSASNINDAITHTCCLTARDLDAKAIVAATDSGHTARMIARFRPACPVAAMTTREKVRRQLAICWGVIPFLTGEVNSTDRIFSLAAEVAVKEGLVEHGDTVVITAGVPLGRSGSTNLLKATVIDQEEM